MEGTLGLVIEKVSRFMQVVSGVALTCIMLLTVADVGLRIIGRPIIGTYELVGLGGATVIGFAMPITSWVRGHIFVDVFYQKCPPWARNGLNVLTRLVAIALFVLIGWNLMRMGADLHEAGEVTLTRRLPFYPVAYGLGTCCFIQCLVLVCDIFKIAGGKYE